MHSRQLSHPFGPVQKQTHVLDGVQTSYKKHNIHKELALTTDHYPSLGTAASSMTAREGKPCLSPKQGLTLQDRFSDNGVVRTCTCTHTHTRTCMDVCTQTPPPPPDLKLNPTHRSLGLPQECSHPCLKCRAARHDHFELEVNSFPSRTHAVPGSTRGCRST